MSNYSLTKQRVFQWLLIIGALCAVAGSYFYYRSQAAVTNASPSTEGLLGYWSFDEERGSVAGDGSGNGNAGTLTNMEAADWVDGARDSALDFDGSSEYVDLGNTIMDSVTDEFSVSLWVKPDVAAQATFFFSRADLAGSSYDTGLYSGGSGVWAFYVTNASGTTVSSISTSTAVAGEWYHIVGKYDGAKTYLYINGVLVDSDNQTGNLRNASNYTTTIAGGWSSNKYDGKVDEVRIYDKALGAEEITALYQLGATQMNASANASLTSSLVGHWTFDGADISGTTVTGRGSGGNNGTLTGGPTVSEGRTGQALAFDGTNDSVDVSGFTSDTLFTDATFTVSTWFRASASGATAVLVSKGARADSSYGGWALYLESTGKIGLLTKQNSAANATTRITNAAYNDGQWHHVVAVITTSTSSAGANTISLYVDGKLDQATLTQTAAYSSSSQPVHIGRRPGSTASYFSGTIDDVRIYSASLTDAQIWSLYEYGNPDTINSASEDSLTEGLTGYWGFDEGTGTSAADATGNANTGTLAGGLAWSTGQVGGAVTFDGSNDYVTIPDASTVDARPPMTAAAWVKRDAVSEVDVVFSKRSSGGWTFGISATNVLFFTFFSVVDLTGTVSANNTNWNHIAVTVEATGAVRFYLNGTPAGSSTISAPFGTDTSPLYMGVGQASNSAILGYTDFSMDDARIYNRALSSEEISRLYRITAPQDVEPGLIGHWSFNGRDLSGTTAYDRSGKGNNGTLTNGPVVTEGKVGQALDFDGSNDHVTLGDVAAIDAATALSICAWVKHDTVTTDDAIVVKRSAGDGSGFVFWREDVGGSRDDTYTFYVEDTGGSLNARVEGAANASPRNVWTHVCGTFEANTANGLNLYVNGALDPNSGVSTVGVTGIDADTQAVTIGYDNITSRPFDGSIDEVRIYNTVLSAADITNLYNQGR